MKRIFIVGTARSGTTLLQSIIANHPEVFSLPETHFFPYSIPRNKWLRPFSAVKEAQIERIKGLLNEMGYGQDFNPGKKDLKDLGSWTRYLIHFLDQRARSAHKDIWLEKTPMHLHYIDLIKKHFPDCYFIHTIREPKANIAALYTVSKNHPGAFKQASLQKARDRYIQELKISEKFYGQAGHLHLYYEDIVQEPQKVIRKSLEFLNLAPAELLEAYTQEVDQLILKNESWKANNRKALKLEDKLAQRLNPSELRQLQKDLSSLNSKLLQPYEGFNR